jgi:hypothetical protein
MSEDLLQSVFFLPALEGRFGSQQDVKYNTTTPHITLISKIPFNDLRRYIAYSSHQLATFNARFIHLEGSTKVE